MGPRGSGRFEGLEPDESAKLLCEFNLLGEAFECDDANGMSEHCRFLDDPLELVQRQAARFALAARELGAAVEFAKSRGAERRQISDSIEAGYGQPEGSCGLPPAVEGP